MKHAVIAKLVQNANALNDEELRDLFNKVRDLIVARQNAKAVAAAVKFSPGQEVEFESKKKHGATVRIRIEKIALKNIIGREVYRNGLFGPKNDETYKGMKWSVHPTLLKEVR